MARQLSFLSAGVLLFVLAFPPADLGFLGFLALAPFVLALHGTKGWKILLLTYAAGVVLFGAACFWLIETAPVNLIGVALTQGIALPLFAFLYRYGTGRGGLPVWLCTPVAWIFAEYVRSTCPLDGFPWLLLGYTAWRIPPLLQTADLFGVWGPGLLMALCSGVIAGYILERKEAAPARGRIARHLGAALLVLLAATAGLYGFLRPASIATEEGPVLAAVQGNIPQKLKGDNARRDEIQSRYRKATARLFQSGEFTAPDLVVWPETIGPPLVEGTLGDAARDAVASEYEKKYLLDPVVKTLTGPAGAWFLVGAESYSLGDGGMIERRNSVFLFDPAGTRTTSYSKTVLVPGGEYIPWIEVLPFRDAIESFVLSVAGFLPDLKPGVGPRLHTLEADGRRYTFGTQICFENIYGDYCRRFVLEGAEFMVNISNEGWFGTSAEFDQMMAMSLFRAVETRRTLFRCTNTGISCVIGPLGRVPSDVERIVENGRDRGVEGVLCSGISLCRTRTLYVRFGDVLPKFLVLVQIVLAVLCLLKSRVVTKES